MTNCNLADITLVIDRSGSMAMIQEEAQSGINAFVREQAHVRGQANLTLVHFDTEYEFVHHGVPIAHVPEYTLMPRGCTALLDAVGRAIQEVGQRLAALPEEARPGLVVFAIVTDGHENSSREFTLQQVREMITHQREVYKWEFAFLCVDPAAFDEAVAMGVDQNAVAQYDPANARALYKSVSGSIGRRRARASAGFRDDALAFTAEEREAMKTSHR